jgi:hypothetical protein
MNRVFAAAISAAFIFFSASFVSSAQGKIEFTEASDLTLVGKLMPDTPCPYARVDTVRFKGFTASENWQVRMSSGISVAFKTDSKKITVKAEYGKMQNTTNTNFFSARGFDLYIKKDGHWLWAGSCCPTFGKENGKNTTIAENMDGSMHECLLYLPLYSEVKSVKIGTLEGSTIEPMENPFRYRVGIFGSSYTHGSSTSRAGMTYPAQFSRRTGIQMLSLGCSGNSKLQPYFADVLAAAPDIDAFVFDAFSNPSPQQIRERLFPFIEKVQAAHPGVPLIFQQTIRREIRNFDTKRDAAEQAKIDVADSLMKIAVKKYKDVYFIHPNATADDHQASVDGVHPTNYGYELWERSIEKPLLRILRKYGIK